MYSAIQREDYSAIYRFSAVMTAPVDPDALQRAIDAVMPRFPTFAVRILFRQNASWQGSVTWLEGNREESFRSVLELIFLMDSALSGR